MSPLRFDHYVERCLYDPTDGFYSSGRGVAGRRQGDFITSPEVGPLFGAVLAAAINQWWEELGRPDPFLVVDAGSGPGTLLKTLEVAAPACAGAWELRGVDRNASSGEVADLGDLTNAVVVANELLDNLPFRVLERGPSDWFEVYVDGDREVLELLGNDPPFDIPVGRRAPLLSAADRWVTQVLEAGAARLVVFDYGALTTAELAERGGFVRTYRQHERGSDPYHQPGHWDITTDVAFDQLVAPDMLLPQHDFLRRFGIEDLVAEGRRYWSDHASAPDITALRMRSRISEVEALLDPAGLGSWIVGVWSRP